MDYSDIYEMSRAMALAQGVSEAQYDKAETWYYDETDNVKHLVLLESRRPNATENTCFVLGGIQAEDTITDDELHAALGKQPGRELKATKDLKGNFIDILRKDAFQNVLQLVEERGWNIHFIMVQVWYYAFVDIIDSINDQTEFAYPLKALLYKILKSASGDTINLFGKYHYPDIKDKDRAAFLEELSALVQKFIISAPNTRDRRFANVLMTKLNEAEGKELTFIQDETPDEWVKMFVQFYSSEIYSYPNKTLVFDTERQVERLLSDMHIEIEGRELRNYSFADSASNPMIQVCDYVVSILRKFFMFADRDFNVVLADIANFDEQQLQRFRLLNRVVRRSQKESPLYFHYIASIETQSNINQLIERFG